ncbi:MAG: hypothetical protein ACT4OX_16435, partial [Actinomycetota bacterium]
DNPRPLRARTVPKGQSAPVAGAHCPQRTIRARCGRALSPKDKTSQVVAGRGPASPRHGVELAAHALGRVLKVAEAVALEHDPLPGYPTAPDLDRLLASVRLRSEDFEVIAHAVDEQLERLADFLGVEP